MHLRGWPTRGLAIRPNWSPSTPVKGRIRRLRCWEPVDQMCAGKQPPSCHLAASGRRCTPRPWARHAVVAPSSRHPCVKLASCSFCDRGHRCRRQGAPSRSCRPQSAQRRAHAHTQLRSAGSLVACRRGTTAPPKSAHHLRSVRKIGTYDDKNKERTRWRRGGCGRWCEYVPSDRAKARRLFCLSGLGQVVFLG